MSFYGVTDIWTYVVGAFGIILLPGPNSVFVLSVATSRGVKAGIQGACGVFVGDTLLLTLTALGAASLLRTYPALFMVVKYAGAAYLTWVGFNLLWGAIQKWRSREVPQSKTVPETPAHLAHPFKRALVISLLNPKAILFLLSFFVQFIDPAYDMPEVPFLILSAILMLFSALYLFGLIFAGARWRMALPRADVCPAVCLEGWADCLCGLAAKLATASLN
jgi:leucine efflux protein